MSTRTWLGLCLAGWLAGSMATGHAGAAPREARLPNVVVVFCDDLGWGDLGCQGAQGIRTPHLDRMAREGSRFTRFYVAQAVCSASRAALLTGCYPNRLGIHGALGPKQPIGLHPDETTLAEVLKGRGYATAIVGKWPWGGPPHCCPRARASMNTSGCPTRTTCGPATPRPRRTPTLPSR